MILPALPDVSEIKSRNGVTRRAYLALQQPGGITIDELRKATYGRHHNVTRAEGAINILLRRLDRQLAEHGIAIVRTIDGHAYRLVSR